MAKKDKFAQMQQGGGVGSFQKTLVQAATTVAAIERQQEKQVHQQTQTNQVGNALTQNNKPEEKSVKQNISHVPDRSFPKFMRLSNPQIPLDEYNLVSIYCTSLPNMTRQDFVELAIVEKLHSLGQITDEQLEARQTEIHNRPPRGQRKGTKQINK